MKTKILLFALLCGALNASDKQYVTVVDFPQAGIVTFTMPNDTTTVLCESGLRITTQEAADVVKAMEILKRIAGLIQYLGSTSAITLDAVGHLSPWQETPDELRARANQIEAEQKAVEQNRKDVLWAESILELWKKKLEGAK